MNSVPKFSIIIPTCNRNDLLAKCLDCLAPGAQTLPIDYYEVIVTDDSSQITAEAMIQKNYPWVKWVPGPCKGPAANRNNGAKYAQGEWLIFTDDDCLPECNWLAAYSEITIREPSVYVFEGQTYTDRPKQSLAEVAPINETGGYLWSCNFAIQKHLFQSIGGFDERFPYAAMEDVELNLRLKKLGYIPYFVKSASVCHPWRLISNVDKFRKHQKSIFIYLSLHPEETKRINFIAYLKWILITLLHETIPDCIKFRAKGLRIAIFDHIFTFHTALILLSKNVVK
jgi:GT2 family glycosyltransferase